MKILIRLLTIFSAGLLSLKATSVGLASDHCPICNKKSHYYELQSFSMFGEPSRDFLDSPIFHFSGPRICPWDLFASQSNIWKIEDKNEVARMRKRLEEKPVILLTTEEGKVVDKIREAGDRHPFLLLRELWWLRTLQNPMSIEDEIMMTMKLFDSCYGDFSPVPELREGYRRRLLVLFQRGMAEKKTPEKSRLRYQYLHAEFLRKGGKLEEALKEFSVFDKLLGAIPEKNRAEHEPLVTWTKEQIMRLRLKTLELQSLVASLTLPLTNPFRDEEAQKMSREVALRHRWALEELVKRCVEGDQDASNQLWVLLERDAGKLLAIGGIISFPSLDRFTKSGPRWEEWRSEMAGQLKEGKMPKGIQIKVNQEENDYIAHLLSKLVGGGRPDYLIEAEREADTPEGRLRAALKIMEEGTKDEVTMSVVKVLEELRALDWKLAKEETMFDYPLQYLSKAFALSGERFQVEMEASLTKPWKDPFFREMTRLWLGKPDALAKLEETEALREKQKYPGYGPAQMVYFHLEARKDPAWKERCVLDLKNLNMLNGRVLQYAEVIMTPDLTTVLLESHARLMELIKKEKDRETELDWKPGQALGIEKLWLNVQLLRLPLEVAK